MKKWILGLLGVFLLAVTSLTTSCRHRGDSATFDDDYEYYDSVFIVKTLESYVNGSFTNSTECCSFQTQMKEAAQIDSIFLSIEPYKLRDVANVLTNKVGKFTKKDVVREYARNADIYDNLGVPITKDNPTGSPEIANKEAANLTPKNSATAEMEDQPVIGVGSTTETHIKDTVINGKKVNIETTIKTTPYE